MTRDDAENLSRDFNSFYEISNAEKSAIHKAALKLVNNPYKANIATIYSDWQGHVAISMKRAMFTLASVSLAQFFVLGDAFELQVTSIISELPQGGEVRLKIVFTIAVLVSALLYLLALNRDMRIRNFQAYSVRDDIKFFKKSFSPFIESFGKFIVLKNGAYKIDDWVYAFSGDTRISESQK